MVGAAFALCALLPAAGASADDAAYARYFSSYQRPKAIPYPQDNAWTEAREKLGRTLFFDPRLSARGIVSCATCHNPAFSWGDGLPRAIGHEMRPLRRRTPTLLNVAWAPALFWDGRASTLEEQALGPIQAEGEMNMPLAEMVGRIQAIGEYRSLFDAAYPGEGISAQTVAKAIATFERGVVSEEAPFDRWIGGDSRAIPEAAKRGFELFNSKAECSGCHSGWRFTDDGFYDIGLRGDDRGRGALLEDIEVVQFAFKAPTLRNVARRAPFMHDGSENTLESTVAFYNRGGDVKRPSLSSRVRPLGLSESEQRDLVAFLQTLTSLGPLVELPAAPL